MSIEDVETGPSVPLDALDEVDVADLAGAEVVDHARACFRARNRATARFLVALHESGRAVDGQKGRRALLDEFSGDEAAAALGWSRAMAARWLGLADDLLGRLPEVHAEMRGGALDDVKARVFSDWTRDLADDIAHRVCADVLPEAPELPVGALIERIQQVADALDPEWAARRERNAEKRARVLTSRNPSGTGNLCGYDLPVDRAAAGMARTEAIAAALRRRGVLLRIETLRAHVYLALLDGTAAGLDDDTLVDLLAADLRPDDDPSRPDGPDDPSGPDGPGGPDGPDGPDGPEDKGPDPGPSDGGPHDRPNDEPSDGPSDEPSGNEPDDDEPDDDHGPRAEGEPRDRDGDGDADGDGDGGGDPTEPDSSAAGPGAEADDPDAEPDTSRGPAVRNGTVEVRLRLTTALGLDDLPATVPGWGVVTARTARTMVERYRRGEWRVVLTDDDGRLEHVLLARRRPRGARPPGPRRDRRRGRTGPAIVELQVPTTLLAALDPDDHPAWAPLLDELRRRLADLTDPDTGRPPGAPDDHVHPDDARHRRPSAEVARWVRVRDRHCVAPCCRRAAHGTDLDHTVDHALGGPTLSRGLGAWCRHHHRAKHDGGWRVTQPEPGRFLITTRAGARYETRPRRVTDPLPAPCPAPAPRPLPIHEQDHGDDHPGDDHPGDDHPDDDHPDDDRTPAHGPPPPPPPPPPTGPDEQPDAAPPEPARPTTSTRALLRRAASGAEPCTEPGTEPDLDPPPF